MLTSLERERQMLPLWHMSNRGTKLTSVRLEWAICPTQLETMIVSARAPTGRARPGAATAGERWSPRHWPSSGSSSS